MKYTPGPWKAIDNSWVEESGKICGTVDIMKDSEQWLWIGDAKPYGGDFTDRETARANAHIMAKAPEMVELLNKIATDKVAVPPWIIDQINKLLNPQQ